MLGRLLYEAICCVGIPCTHYKHCHANTTLQTLPNKHTYSPAQCSRTHMPTCPHAHMLTCTHKVGPYQTQLCNTAMPITQPIMPPPRDASHTKPHHALPRKPYHARPTMHYHANTTLQTLQCKHHHARTTCTPMQLPCTHNHARQPHQHQHQHAHNSNSGRHHPRDSNVSGRLP